MDVYALEKAEAQIDQFIEKRAREKADEQKIAELWAESDRREREKRRRENAQAWHDYYSSMARVHHGIAAEHAKRADGVLELLEHGVMLAG